MTVQDLRSQEARHVETGAIVRSRGREALQFELGGRVATIGSELGRDGDIVYLPAEPRWDDGETMAADVASLLEPVIGEVERHWGLKASFVRR